MGSSQSRQRPMNATTDTIMFTTKRAKKADKNVRKAEAQIKKLNAQMRKIERFRQKRVKNVQNYQEIAKRTNFESRQLR